MTPNHFVSGENNIICDICGKKIKINEARVRWDGFLVCHDDWETRHPQDFVRARQDKISVDMTRPRPPDVFEIKDSVNFSDLDDSDGSGNGNEKMEFGETLFLSKKLKPYIAEGYWTNWYVTNIELQSIRKLA
jgi:hypothetical protein